MRKVDPRDPLMPPNFAKASLVVEQAQLLNDVVHDQVDVDLGFVAHTLLVCFTQLADLTDIESLIRVQLEHAHHYTAQLRRILLTQRRVLPLGDPLEELVQRQVLFVILPEGASKLANLIRYAPQGPHIRLPVVAFALEDLRAHVERGAHS